MVWDADGKEIKERYDALGKLNNEEKIWAGLLLAEKLSIAGGGMIAALHRDSLNRTAKFRNFKMKWQHWWDEIGEKKYQDEVKLTKKAFHKNYAKVDGIYQRKSEIEPKLTTNEIKWIKGQYQKNRRNKR